MCPGLIHMQCHSARRLDRHGSAPPLLSITSASRQLAFPPVAKILLIDDNESIRRLLRGVLLQCGHAVTEAANGRDGLKLCADADLVILDLFMPEQDGIEVLTELRRRHALVKVIAMSGGVGPGAGDNLHTARLLGAAKTLQKPFTIEEFMAAINELLPAGDENLPSTAPSAN